jgi:hypothetical protein
VHSNDVPAKAKVASAGIIPFYVTLKAVALSFLWVGEGTQMLQRFVVKMVRLV